MKYCKLIKEDENNLILEALRINNSIWNVKSTLKDFKDRTENGYLVGLMEENLLLGTISSIPLSYNKIMNNYYPTWDSATDNGTFLNAEIEGDSLCCVAITNRFSKVSIIEKIDPKGIYKEWIKEVNNDNWRKNKILSIFINKAINKYLDSNLDPVINFHKRDKSILSGAKIIKIFPDGRVEDKDSLGFNILMSYPTIDDNLRKKIDINSIDCSNIKSIGVSLILGIFKEGLKNKNIKYILPYSRPIKFRYYLTRTLYRYSNHLDFDSSNEEIFFQNIKQILTKNF